MTTKPPIIVPPDLQASYKQYFDTLAATPMSHSVPDRDAPPAPGGMWKRARNFGVVAVVAVVSSVLAIGTYAFAHGLLSGGRTASAPTSCDAAGKPSVLPSMTASQLAQAIQQLDQWESACAAAWWTNLDLTTVNWATVPHHAGPLADYSSPQFTTLRDAVVGADTIVVARVTSVSKMTQGVGFQLLVTQVIKGSPSSSVTLVDEGGIAPATAEIPPTGVAIQDDLGTGFPLPGQQVVVFGKLSGSQLHAQPYSGLYFINTDGTVSSAGANPFAKTVDGSTETSFLSSIQSAIAGG